MSGAWGVYSLMKEKHRREERLLLPDYNYKCCAHPLARPSLHTLARQAVPARAAVCSILTAWSLTDKHYKYNKIS